MISKIAIIEDDPFTQKLYTLFMRRAGFEAFIMEDANLLLQKLNNEKIALIIMDINLRNTYLHKEKINGIQLSKYIKTHDKYCTIPVILVSAFSMAAEEGNLLKESLAHQFIKKPITDFDSFLTTIKETMLN